MSPVSAPAQPGFKIVGWHVLVAVSAFFTVVIGVDLSFMALAIRTFPGQVSVTPYEDGLLYNQHIAQLNAQDRLGWRAAVRADPGQVVMLFRDQSGRPLDGLTITAQLERPATEAGRIQLRFRATGDGRYVAQTGAISGAWDLTADAHGAGVVKFVAERRLTWP